jgi:hypothetical protein
MRADACPVLEGEGSWLLTSVEKLTTEAPVNGGRNYKINRCSYKIELYAGTSLYLWLLFLLAPVVTIVTTLYFESKSKCQGLFLLLILFMLQIHT